ncbi:MAG: mechanosensitive ion channel family protein [Polyangiaceae bacterium]
MSDAAAFFQRHSDLILRVIYALAIAGIGLVLARVAAGMVARNLHRRGHPRAVTLAPILKTLTFVVLGGVAIVTGLDKLGVPIGTVLAGAGVLGLAIGFGAQTLVKDCLSGFFLILDGVLAQGDLVELDGSTGTVESVGLRMTQVRNFDGRLFYVPNGEIKTVANYNRGWARAIVEVGVSYEQDVARGLRVLEQVGAEWAAENRDLVIEEPEAQGVMGLNASDVGVRLLCKIKNEGGGTVFGVERDLRRKVKAAFDEAGVEIPFPRTVVYHRAENDDDAAAEAAE